MTRRRSVHADRGSVSVEAAILMPAFLVLAVLAVIAGRTTVAQNALDLAAHDAARAASISRDAATARTRAEDSARTTLHRQALHCLALDVDVDTSEFANPAGQPASVRVRVACTVSFADVALPGAPGQRHLSAEFTSAIDQYRSRR
jgi:Flp pilus assembly protein TadG